MREYKEILIRMGNNTKNELCVQIIMNIPLAKLIKESLKGGKNESKKKASRS